MFFITRFSKIYLKVVLWLPTASIHADPVLSLRVGKNQEQQDSTRVVKHSGVTLTTKLFNDPEDMLFQQDRTQPIYDIMTDNVIDPHTARVTIALSENGLPDYRH